MTAGPPNGVPSERLAPLDNRATNVRVGTSILCPRCGGRDENGRRRHDPEYVAWHCFAREPGAIACTAELPRAEDEHGRCGYQVMLPLPETETHRGS